MTIITLNHILHNRYKIILIVFLTTHSNLFSTSIKDSVIHELSDNERKLKEIKISQDYLQTILFQNHKFLQDFKKAHNAFKKDLNQLSIKSVSKDDSDDHLNKITDNEINFQQYLLELQEIIADLQVSHSSNSTYQVNINSNNERKENTENAVIKIQKLEKIFNNLIEDNRNFYFAYESIYDEIERLSLTLEYFKTKAKNYLSDVELFETTVSDFQTKVAEIFEN